MRSRISAVRFGSSWLLNIARISAAFASNCSVALLGGGDALKLALAPEVGFKFSEHPQHVQERLAIGAARVDGLLGGLDGDAALLQRVPDVLQILDAARQAADPRDDPRVALPQEIKQRRQLRAAARLVPLAFLARTMCTSGAQCLLLQSKILIAAGTRAYPWSAMAGLVSLRFDPSRLASRRLENDPFEKKNWRAAMVCQGVPVRYNLETRQAAFGQQRPVTANTLARKLEHGSEILAAPRFNKCRNHEKPTSERQSAERTG